MQTIAKKGNSSLSFSLFLTANARKDARKVSEGIHFNSERLFYLLAWKWRNDEQQKEVKVAAERRKKLSNVPDLVPSTFQIPDLIFLTAPFYQLHSQETQTQPATNQSRKQVFQNDSSGCARSAAMKSFHLAGQSGQLSWPSVTSLLTRGQCFLNWRFGCL